MRWDVAAMWEVGPNAVSGILAALNVAQTVLIAWLTLRYESNARNHPRRRSDDG